MREYSVMKTHIERCVFFLLNKPYMKIMRVVDSRSNRKILLINKFFDSTINPGLYYLANTIGFCIKKTT